MTPARQSESVEELCWRDAERLRADITAVENALMCDPYRPEIKAAVRALLRLGSQAGTLAEGLRKATPLLEED